MSVEFCPRYPFDPSDLELLAVAAGKDSTFVPIADLLSANPFSERRSQ